MNDASVIKCLIVDCPYEGTKNEIIFHLTSQHALSEERAEKLFDSITEMRKLNPEHKQTLLEAAQELGAVKIPKEFQESKGIKDILGESKISFFPELPRMRWENLVHKTFLVKNIKIIEDWDSMMGTSDFPLLRVQTEDGKEYTTLGSGVAILKQAKKLLSKRLFPVKVFLNKIPSATGEYYLLE